MAVDEKAAEPEKVDPNWLRDFAKQLSAHDEQRARAEQEAYDPPPTEDELAQMERWARADEERDEFWTTVADGRLHRFLTEHHGKPWLEPVAKIMREGVEPPRMLVEDWLVDKELHWLFADAEAGKTWLALHLSRMVMEQGGTVVYFDEELGASVIAERLIALEVDPSIVESNFVYAPFPAWEMTTESHALHRDFLRALRPQLVVYDTITDILANAGLDENMGRDVTAWVKAYPEEARKLGCTQLVLDHVGVATAARVVGSRAKRAKAKVMYKLAKVKGSNKFTPEDHGEVVVHLDKNTRGARIPAKREFRIGGSPFLWQEMSNSATVAQLTVRQRVNADIMSALREEPGITKTKLLDSITGAKDQKAEVFNSMVSAGTIRTEDGNKGSIRCFSTVQF